MYKTINFCRKQILLSLLFTCCVTGSVQALTTPPVTNTSVEPQEEYPLQDNIKIKYESSTCSLNRSKVAGVRVWQAKVSDGNLHNVLSRWAKQAGWAVKWNSTYDFPIEYPWTIKATFDCAVNELLRNTQDTQLPLVGQMYLGNKILLIIDGK